MFNAVHSPMFRTGGRCFRKALYGGRRYALLKGILISLRRSMKDRELADVEQLFQKSLGCYLGAIDTIRSHAVEVSPEDLKEHRERLGALRRSIQSDPSSAMLEESVETLGREIVDYNAKIASFYDESKAEVEQVLGLLQDATRALSERDVKYDTQFKGFAKELEATARCESLQQVRLQITLQASKLRNYVAAMRSETAEALEPLRAELRSTENRLQAAERLASTDALTNLFNRREGEKRLGQKISSAEPVCMMVVDLDRFKSINDRFGHHCGDEVLRLFAKKLQENVRAGDTACRWGGDEFVVIMGCQLKDALPRSRQMAGQLRSRYPVTLNGKRIEVELSASIGVAQCIPGEAVEASFERADAMLYQMKQQPAPSAVG